MFLYCQLGRRWVFVVLAMFLGVEIPSRAGDVQLTNDCKDPCRNVPEGTEYKADCNALTKRIDEMVSKWDQIQSDVSGAVTGVQIGIGSQKDMLGGGAAAALKASVQRKTLGPEMEQPILTVAEQAAMMRKKAAALRQAAGSGTGQERVFSADKASLIWTRNATTQQERGFTTVQEGKADKPEDELGRFFGRKLDPTEINPVLPELPNGDPTAADTRDAAAAGRMKEVYDNRIKPEMLKVAQDLEAFAACAATEADEGAVALNGFNGEIPANHETGKQNKAGEQAVAKSESTPAAAPSSQPGGEQGGGAGGGTPAGGNSGGGSDNKPSIATGGSRSGPTGFAATGSGGGITLSGGSRSGAGASGTAGAGDTTRPGDPSGGDSGAPAPVPENPSFQPSSQAKAGVVQPPIPQAGGRAPAGGGAAGNGQNGLGRGGLELATRLPQAPDPEPIHDNSSPTSYSGGGGSRGGGGSYSAGADTGGVQKEVPVATVEFGAQGKVPAPAGEQIQPASYDMFGGVHRVLVEAQKSGRIGI